MTGPGQVDLATTLCGLTLPTPVMVAAGCGGTGRELAPYVDLSALGALVTRTVTLEPGPGGTDPRLVETPSGLLGTRALHGPGVDGFLATELPWLAQRRVRTVVSIAALSLGEYAELARRVGNSPGVTAVEVNLAHADRDPRRADVVGGAAFETGKMLGVVRREVPRGIPVLAKLPGSLALGVVDVARAAADAGSDAVVLGHGPLGLALDAETLTPTLGSGAGALSGPAIRPLALHQVWLVHQALPDLPLVGGGGVRTGTDALHLLAVGATAVQLGTTMLHDPSSPERVAGELREELARRGLDHPAEAVGRAHLLEETPA